MELINDFFVISIIILVKFILLFGFRWRCRAFFFFWSISMLLYLW